MPEGTATLLKPTEAAKTLLGGQGVEVKPFLDNASLEHEYWKHRIAEDYRRRGYEVQDEVPIGGGMTADPVAARGKDRIAVEIDAGTSDVQGNLEKCREAGFERGVVIHTIPSRSRPHRASRPR